MGEGEVKKKRFEINHEVIEKFLNGDDPMERIVNMTYNYMDDFVKVYYRDENDIKHYIQDPFKPFLWATTSACKRLCEGNRDELRRLMSQYDIGIKKLSNISNDGVEVKQFLSGYMYMIFARRKMSYNKFLTFFKKAKNPVYSRKGEEQKEELKNQYIVVTPVEQHMISTGKRFFKGYDDYDQLLRMTIDLETTGLDKERDRIIQIGIRLNRPIPSRPEGFSKIFTVTGNTEEERNNNERKVIKTLFKAIRVFEPDIITAHNGENFDWNFIIGSCKRLGGSIEEWSSPYFDGEPIRKSTRETILKLGGEIEKFFPTEVPECIVTDSLHAVRRAQAIDSSMQSGDLKYSTEYWGLKKKNRVYTPGGDISKIWADKEHKYAFCEADGDWYVYDEENGDSVKHRGDFASDDEYTEYIQSLKSKVGDKAFKMRYRNELLEGYEITTGQYIVERYLMDDLYECDKVELKGNSTNFLICKILPIPYKKCTTMGTAGQWKAIMLAWSYKYGLAIPPFENTGSFTGGLSRLLRTGYVNAVIKLDFNSLYPSILLTWGIHDEKDLLNAMLIILCYVLDNREKYKKEKKKANEIIDQLKGLIINNTATREETDRYLKALKDYSLADGKQSQVKCLGNSYFGSYGSNIGSLFPWKSVICAENTTCVGRQGLRLMISYFSTISERFKLNDKRYNYQPIVGDSVTGDTPLFIKYKSSGLIDIRPISELIDEKSVEKDMLGREYDASEKSYQVLCRTGWCDVEYVYRHKTDKPIYRVSESNMEVDVTEDHSLFDENRKEVKPTEINENTRLEYYKKEDVVADHRTRPNINFILEAATGLAKGRIDRVPIEILNAEQRRRKVFMETLVSSGVDINTLSKTARAGINYIS